MTLNRFDPGRDQVGSSARVPTALLPGDVLVPCLFSTQTETSPVTVIQSEAEIHHSVKVKSLRSSVSTSPVDRLNSADVNVSRLSSTGRHGIVF